MSDPIPFKPAPVQTHSLTRVRKKSPCPHRALILNIEEREVRCKNCEVVLDPYQALETLCSRIWWEENARERQLEYDAKRVSKVQRIAIEHLHATGVTPEKYAIRWAAEEEKRKVIPVDEIKTEVALYEPEKAG